jgi:hypothetical protein
MLVTSDGSLSGASHQSGYAKKHILLGGGARPHQRDGPTQGRRLAKRYIVRRSPARPPTGHKLVAALAHGDVVIVPDGFAAD